MKGFLFFKLKKKKTSEWEDMSLHSNTLMNIPIPSRPVFVLTP